MITINLKPGIKRAKAGTSFAGGLSALKELPARIKDPWPMAAIVVWVLLLGFLGWVGIGSATTLHRIDTQMTKVRAENENLRHLIADRRRAQTARDSVVSQIATIRAVDGDRYVWPHLLDEITRALPAYTWLTDLSTITQTVIDSTSTAPLPIGVQLNGRTMDIQGFTHFMRQLEESPWLSGVTLISTGTEIDHGRAVTVFTVKATYVRQPPPKPAQIPGGN
ncbi:MAG TPA: PilN domain-containing protein [Gemmatimonadales bacterium]|nr:PilN domain-containing protein [Gemmatimonadales bacterium]